MTTGEQKQVTHYLLTQMTATLLANSPVKDGIQKAAERHQNALRAKLTKEEYTPILAMRDVVAELCKKLANCPDVLTLEQTYEYIKALNRGEVMIAVEDEATGAVVGYEPNC